MAQTGRPSAYNREAADEICRLLADGVSLRRICRENEHLPARSTIKLWVVDDVDGFSARYLRAKAEGIDEIVDEALDISDDGTNDTYLDDEGNRRTDNDVLGRSKLRVDTRKWYASKLAPKLYGDKIDVTSGGEKLPASAEATDVAARVAALLALAQQRADEPGADLV